MKMIARPKISVCMATFNGARFVAEQLNTILSQLASDDEVIVVDDASVDDTVAIIAAISDNRIRILENPCNAGVLASFERALKECCGEIIFLSDQDDRWIDSKVERTLLEFQDRSVTLVVSAAYLMRPDGSAVKNGLHRALKRAPGFIATVIKNQYQGSLMAFRRSILPVVLPIPKSIAMHDWWIGAVNGIIGRTAVIAEPLVLYRRHDNNVTSLSCGSPHSMLKNRSRLLIQVICRIPKLLRYRSTKNGVSKY